MTDKYVSDPAVIEDCLQRIVASRRFTSSSNLNKFLLYVVEMKLAGKEAEIKGYSIALDALGRPETFDAQNDPTVRMHAARLRNALRDYYDDEGASDPVRIHLPKGRYVPEFLANEIVSRNDTAKESKSVVPLSSHASKKWRIAAAVLCALVIVLGWMAFVISPSFNRSSQGTRVAANSISIVVKDNTPSEANSADIETSTQFVESFRAALVRNEALLVVPPKTTASPDLTDTSELGDTDFVINLIARKIGTSQRISLELTNGRTDVLLWSRARDIRSENISQRSYEEIVTQLVGELDVQIFGASIAALEGRDPNTLTALQLFVLATWIPGPARNSLKWEKQRIELARLALTKAPEFGPAHSVLADKLAYLAAVDGPSNSEEALVEAKGSAARALELAPGDANTVFNVAQSQWHSGLVKESIRTMKRVLELDPSHGIARFLSTVYPFTCGVAPDEVLNSAIAFDRSLEKDNPIRWVTLTWIGWLHLNRKEFKLALDDEQHAALIFQVPYTTMRHAAVLNQLGRSGKAAEIILSQRSNWPNIDPAHFAKVTIPRICQEFSNPEIMLGYYESLAQAVMVGDAK